MTDTLFRKNIILKDYRITHDLYPGLEKINRFDNGENHVTLTGTKSQINDYLEHLNQNILSERLRTLKNVPHYRIIGTKKQRIQ